MSRINPFYSHEIAKDFCGTCKKGIALESIYSDYKSKKISKREFVRECKIRGMICAQCTHVPIGKFKTKMYQKLVDAANYPVQFKSVDNYEPVDEPVM